MSFYKKLKASWGDSNSLLCVGLDPDLQKMPALFKSSPQPYFEFCASIVDATQEFACAFKPQIAYFSAAGAEDQLLGLIHYIQSEYPNKPVILDAKRGDIDSTASMYAKEVFDRYYADAVTINPYLGFDTLKPFLDRSEKGVVILCRTSNPGAKTIQDLESDGKKIFEIVAQKAASEWNYNNNVMLVVGATYPEELGHIRAIAPQIPFLVPGIGAQGGDVKAVLKQGLNSEGSGLVISSSRAIIYASSGSDFAEAAADVAKATNKLINECRNL